MIHFFFYIKLGLQHVLNFNAYDHILFLLALALPFTFKDWKKVVLLSTIFTLAHCMSLFFSVYNIVVINELLIEFLIIATIILTSIINMICVKTRGFHNTILCHSIASALFGFIHGFGFSNYFKMLIAEEESKLLPLLGFTIGIELSQVLIVIFVLLVTYTFTSLLKIKHPIFVVIVSILIVLVTIPMLNATFS